MSAGGPDVVGGVTTLGRLPARRTVPTVLSIAGSDSGGGAGIQADLKAFAAAGVHGTTAITAITVQNTIAVEAFVAVDPDVILGQVRAVASDLGVDAVKVGVLGSVATTEAVATALRELAGTPIVIDPVMVAESGASFVDADAEQALRELVALATVVTPNVAEARVLARDDAGTLSAEQLVRAIHALGPSVVVLTGGHREEASDLFFDGEHLAELGGERHADGAAHGSGCTHSSTLAARLALGDRPLEAARAAKAVAAAAVRDGLRDLGRGAGPVDVFGLARRGARTAPEEARRGL